MRYGGNNFDNFSKPLKSIFNISLDWGAYTTASSCRHAHVIVPSRRCTLFVLLTNRKFVVFPFCSCPYSTNMISLKMYF